MERRDFLRALAALGGVMATRPVASFAGSSLGGLPFSAGASRISRLAATENLFLVHTDLHNHSLISGDALGDPGRALDQIRKGGIDVACLTEHAISGKGHGEITCPGHKKGGCDTVEGINDSDWQTMSYIADGADDPGSFVAFRGFEYSTPTVGHLNVWFSSQFTDPLRQRALITPRAISEVDQIFPQSQPVVDQFEQAPDIATIKTFYDWLASAPDTALFGGGNDGLAGFNHPGDFGDFEAWAYHPGAASLVTQFEAFNTNGYDEPDFFWYGADEQMPNPFNACLNAGWRVGFTGVSDEHSGVYRGPGQARGGLWVSALTREAVRSALIARRSFGSLEPGLRLDATANGAPMGSAFDHDSGTGTVTIELDIDRGPEWAGRELWAQVIRPGPTLLHAQAVASGTRATITVDVDRAAGDWLFLRITDPLRDPHPFSQGAFDEHGGAFAYASPWFLDEP